MQNFTVKTLEIEAKKAVYCVLRMLHAKTGSNKLHALQNAMHWSIDDQDSTIAADLLQAARTELVEYCFNYGYEVYEVIDHAKTGRAITPFSKACSAVNKTIRDYSNNGMRGDYSKTSKITHEPMNAENSNAYGSYHDDHTALIFDNVITTLFNKDEEKTFLDIIVLLSEGYDMKNISHKMNIPLSTIYRLKDKIKKRLLDSGFFDGYR